LANEWPDELEEVKKKKKKSAQKKGDFIDDEDDDTVSTKRPKKFGPLMDMTWYRVVLDEAQAIRVSTLLSCRQAERVDSEL
jgi:SNF2 family DNA or RNA helicase